METTAILRDALGLGRGGSTRRLLTGVRSRFQAEPAPAKKSSRDTQLGDAFWDTRGAAVARKRQVQWFEQTELWNDSPAQDAPPAPVHESPRATVETVAPAGLRFERVDALPAAPADEDDVSTSAPGSFRNHQRTVRMDEIAKFLQVNHAVDGLDVDGHRFNLPVSGFMARFSRALWKGSPVGTPFLTGC